MSETEPHMTTDECTFDLVFGFMLPLFLASAGGDLALARISVIELLSAYEAATPAEIELVARIISFGHVAMDSLSQSMRPGLSDATILRYRGNALAMNRAAEQCRKALEAMQARRVAAEASRSLPAPPRPPRPEMPRPPVPRVPTPPPQPHPHGTGGSLSGDSMAAEIAVEAAIAELMSQAAHEAGSRTPVAEPHPQVPAAVSQPQAAIAWMQPHAAVAAKQSHAAVAAKQSHAAIAAMRTHPAIAAAMADAEAILADVQFRLAGTDGHAPARPATRPQVPPDAPASG